MPNKHNYDKPTIEEIARLETIARTDERRKCEDEIRTKGQSELIEWLSRDTKAKEAIPFFEGSPFIAEIRKEARASAIIEWLESEEARDMFVGCSRLLKPIAAKLRERK
jgi:hypothetical protein